jgi:hypothetical protein
MKRALLPPGALDAYVQGPTSMASEGRRERSDSGKGSVFPYARAWIAGVSPGKEAPWRYKCPPRAPTRPSMLVDCAERGPTRFRAMAGGSDTACGRYIHKNVHFSNTNINS